MTNAPRQRKTRQLDAVRNAVRGMRDFQSAQEIYTKLKLAGETIGLATVYRNLTALCRSGELDQRRASDGTMQYRECDTAHHHHLVCRSCGKTEEFHLEGLEDTLLDLGSNRGYTSIEHTVELTGLCEECSGETS